jgi:predicted DNA-binding transcriptional regulator AlpA
MDLSKLLSIKQYAQKKGISVQAVYQAIWRGSLPTIEIGGKKFIQYDEKEDH